MAKKTASPHKIVCLDIAPAMKSQSHGQHAKKRFVCHESVTYNSVGWGDIQGLAKILKQEGYGCHGMTDMEGHKAWARGMGNAILYHAGGDNDDTVGCENVSEIPILVQKKTLTMEQAHTAWLHREKQLNALAILIACWHNSDKAAHKLVRSTGAESSPGVCSHWDISQHHPESDGHWDCRPYDKGGYFPMAHVIDLAKVYAKAGYVF